MLLTRICGWGSVVLVPGRRAREVIEGGGCELARLLRR